MQIEWVCYNAETGVNMSFKILKRAREWFAPTKYGRILRVTTIKRPDGEVWHDKRVVAVAGDNELQDVIEVDGVGKFDVTFINGFWHVDSDLVNGHGNEIDGYSQIIFETKHDAKEYLQKVGQGA